MPRDGDTPLARFTHAIAQERGFSFGAARLSDNGSSVVLPIERTFGRARGYVLGAELSDEISAVDIGRLDRLRIRNDSGVRVFLPPGTLFEGRETSSRALGAGIFIEPESTCDVEVKCVHAARAICEGAVLRLAPRLAPASVTQAILSHDQGLVWATAAAFVEAHVPPQGGGSNTEPDKAGDLIGSLADLPVVGPTPSGTECGAVLLDAAGVLVVEVFDGPEAWRAATRVRTSSADRSDRLALNPAGAIRIAKEFLAQLPRRAFRPVTPHGFVAVDDSTACTAIEGEVVHLIAFGRDFTRVGAAAPYDSSAGASPATAYDGVGPWHGEGSSGTPVSDDADVAVAAIADTGTLDDSEPQAPEARPRRRKVLTSGWDATTFRALEHYSRKEFGGDRSAALRFLTRSGLSRRGYLGPQLPRPARPPPLGQEATLPSADVEWSFEETRIRDLERVARTVSYAAWLRKRARVELEHLADTSSGEGLRALARTALVSLGPSAPAEEPPEAEEEPEEPEAPPAPPPVDVTPLLRRAVLASASGQFNEALAVFDEVLEVEPVNLTALLGRAVTLRRAGKPQEALAGLDLVLRLDPDNAAAHLNRGRILQERGDLRGALEAFDRLAAVAPNDWDVWMERGDVLARMGRSEDALRSFSEALRRNPDDEKLRRRVEAMEKVKAAELGPSRLVLPAGLEEGQSYLVKGATPEPAYGLLRALARQRLPVLLITRHSADHVRKDPALAAAHVAHLHHGTGPDTYNPAALASLSRLIEHFVEEHHGCGAILLDALDVLVADNTFREALLFVEHVNELVLQRRVIFLIPSVAGMLADRETALLERNLKVLA